MPVNHHAGQSSIYLLLLPYTTLPIYPGLGQAPNMLACIPGGLATTNPQDIEPVEFDHYWLG